MRYVLLCICPWLVCWVNSGRAQQAATPQALLAAGDSLYAIAQYYDAGLFYDEAAFYSANKEEKTTLLFKKSAALKQSGSFNEAAMALSGIDCMSLPDSLRYKAKFEAVLCFYLAGNFNAAEDQLEEMATLLNDPILLQHCYPLHAFVSNELGKWDEAKDYLCRYFRNNPAFADSFQNAQVALVEALYSKEKLPHLKKVRKAALLSMFLPGAGQMYAGYYGEGIASLLFNVCSLGLTATGFYYHYYITSALFGISTFQRFYTGNIHRAEFLVRKTNYQRSKQFNESVKAYYYLYIK